MNSASAEISYARSNHPSTRAPLLARQDPCRCFEAAEPVALTTLAKTTKTDKELSLRYSLSDVESKQLCCRSTGGGCRLDEDTIQAKVIVPDLSAGMNQRGQQNLSAGRVRQYHCLSMRWIHAGERKIRFV